MKLFEGVFHIMAILVILSFEGSGKISLQISDDEA